MDEDDYSDSLEESGGANFSENYSFADDTEGANNASNFNNYDYGGSTTPGTATITDTGTDMFGGGGAGDFGFGFNRNAGKGIEGIDPTYQSNFQSKNLLNDQMANYYTKMRGATDTNPYPDSFFSRMFGVDKVNYTNILGGKQGVKQVNDLRARQAFGLPSLKTGESYQAGDYYIGQPTNMGEVKSIEKPGLGIMSMFPGGAALSAMMPTKGLPVNDPRYQQIMNDRAKEAKEPSVFDGVTDYLKNMFGIDNTPKPVASPVDRVKVNELAPVVNPFDDSTLADASLSQKFRALGDEVQQYVGPDGKEVFGGTLKFNPNIGIDKGPEAQYNYPISNILDRAFG
jgi:hypothetical protein